MSVGIDSSTARVDVETTDRVPHLVGTLAGIIGVSLVVELGLTTTRDLAVPDGYYPGLLTSALLVGGLAYGAFWLARSEIPSRLYGRVAGWVTAGALGFTVFIYFVTISTAPFSPMGIYGVVRWAVSVGAGIGLLIGLNDARAVHEAFQAGLAVKREADVKEERDRLEEFASVISHDLRNPLNVAQGRLALAADECDSEHLESVAQAHDRMDTLIEDVLTLAKAGDAIGETRVVDLDSVAGSAWQQVESDEATLRIEAGTPIVADRTRLQQLLENLFRNAIEHGGADVTITVGDLPDGFYVADDGSGIPASDRSDILDAGFTTSDAGTGFGLSIVRDIAQAHGWTIDIGTSETGGARFAFGGVDRAGESGVIRPDGRGVVVSQPQAAVGTGRLVVCGGAPRRARLVRSRNTLLDLGGYRRREARRSGPSDRQTHTSGTRPYTAAVMTTTDTSVSQPPTRAICGIVR